MPEPLWNEIRMWDLINALSRYHTAQKIFPGEWLIELHQRIDLVLKDQEHERANLIQQNP